MLLAAGRRRWQISAQLRPSAVLSLITPFRLMRSARRFLEALCWQKRRVTYKRCRATYVPCGASIRCTMPENAASARRGNKTPAMICDGRVLLGARGARMPCP